MTRVGLFIGIDNYGDGISTLSCAANDAAQVFQAFVNNGFDEAYLLLDPRDDRREGIENQLEKYKENCDIIIGKVTSNDISEKLNQIQRALQPDDMLVFYYSGHGVTINDSCLLFSSTSNTISVRHGAQEFRFSYAKEITECNGVKRLFILDCCRSDYMAARGAGGYYVREQSRDLVFDRNAAAPNQKVIPPIILSSCCPGQKAYEDILNGHGFFTWALLNTIGDETIYSFGRFKRCLSEKMQELLAQTQHIQDPDFAGPDLDLELFANWQERIRTQCENAREQVNELLKNSLIEEKGLPQDIQNHLNRAEDNYRANNLIQAKDEFNEARSRLEEYINSLNNKARENCEKSHREFQELLQKAEDDGISLPAEISELIAKAYKEKEDEKYSDAYPKFKQAICDLNKCIKEAQKNKDAKEKAEKICKEVRDLLNKLPSDAVSSFEIDYDNGCSLYDDEKWMEAEEKFKNIKYQIEKYKLDELLKYVKECIKYCRNKNKKPGSASQYQVEAESLMQQEDCNAAKAKGKLEQAEKEIKKHLKGFVSELNEEIAEYEKICKAYNSQFVNPAAQLAVEKYSDLDYAKNIEGIRDDLKQSTKDILKQQREIILPKISLKKYPADIYDGISLCEELINDDKLLKAYEELKKVESYLSPLTPPPVIVDEPEKNNPAAAIPASGNEPPPSSSDNTDTKNQTVPGREKGKNPSQPQPKKPIDKSPRSKPTDTPQAPPKEPDKGKLQADKALSQLWEELSCIQKENIKLPIKYQNLIVEANREFKQGNYSKAKRIANSVREDLSRLRCKNDKQQKVEFIFIAALVSIAVSLPVFIYDVDFWSWGIVGALSFSAIFFVLFYFLLKFIIFIIKCLQWNELLKYGKYILYIAIALFIGKTCSPALYARTGWDVFLAVSKITFFNQQSRTGEKALRLAAFNNNLAGVRKFVEQGVPLEGESLWAFYVAAEKGHSEIVKYFLEKGVDPELETLYGSMKCLPVEAAKNNGHYQTAKIIYKWLGVKYQKKKNKRKAAKYFKLADRQDSMVKDALEKFEKVRKEAIKPYKERRWDAAIKSLTDYCQIDTDVLPKLYLANACYMQKKYKDAEVYYKQIAADTGHSFSQSDVYQACLVISYYYLKQNEKASKLYKYQTLSLENASELRLLGSYRFTEYLLAHKFETNDFPVGKENYDTAEKIFNSLANAKNNKIYESWGNAALGALYEARENWQKALEYYKKSRRSGHYPACVRSGIDNVKKKLEEKEKGREKQQADSMAAGLALFKKGEYKNAIEQLLKADQNNDSVLNALGECYENLIDYPKAAEYYKKASDEGNADAMFNLGWLYAKGKLGNGNPDYKKAAEYYRKSLREKDHPARVNGDLERVEKKLAEKKNKSHVSNAKTNSAMKVYKVARGDTLSLIAYSFGMTTKAIIKLNNITFSTGLNVGMPIMIPENNWLFREYNRKYAAREISLQEFIKNLQTLYAQADSTEEELRKKIEKVIGYFKDAHKSL